MYSVEAGVMMNIGEIASKWGMQDKALAAVESAIEIANALGDARAAKAARNKRNRLMAARGRFDAER